MTQAKFTLGPLTFTAGVDLEQYRRVKLESGSTTVPKEVVYADAGEDFIGITMDSAEDGELIAIAPLCREGTFLLTASKTISALADVYGAADGKISDASSGTAYFKALEAATAAGDIIECILHPGVSTTAATVSISDSDHHTEETTVEAALAEIYAHILNAQNFMPIPLSTLLEGGATNVVGPLKDDTTPVLDMADGDTDSGLVVTWAASNSDPVLFQVPLPPDLDTTEDLVIHLRAKSGGDADTPTIASDAYFNEGDTKVEDVSAELGETYAEKTITIDASDIPSGAQTLTVELTPGEHTTNTVVMSALWIEYTKQLLS
jgi:hypothetical protein